MDQVLDLTWDQIGFASECVLMHKVSMINLVAEPVLGALGSKYKKSRISKDKKDKNEESKDAEMMFNISAAGFGVETI